MMSYLSLAAVDLFVGRLAREGKMFALIRGAWEGICGEQASSCLTVKVAGAGRRGVKITTLGVGGIVIFQGAGKGIGSEGASLILRVVRTEMFVVVVAG